MKMNFIVNKDTPYFSHKFAGAGSRPIKKTDRGS